MDLCHKLGAALCPQIVRSVEGHVLFALESLGTQDDVVSCRELDAAVFALCGKICSRERNVLSCAHQKSARISADGNVRRLIKDVLMGQFLCGALCVDIILCIKENRGLSLNGAGGLYVGI